MLSLLKEANTSSTCKPLQSPSNPEPIRSCFDTSTLRGEHLNKGWLAGVGAFSQGCFDRLKSAKGKGEARFSGLKLDTVLQTRPWEQNKKKDPSENQKIYCHHLQDLMTWSTCTRSV